ncbi:MAG: hypothetical protein KAU28_05090 [Phycisphaerae bacterium]|nr:hypothetical protein [Phycisphaerae bacterium]
MNPNNPAIDLEDELSELDPPYRSRQETHVGRMLDRYGIPFFYEQPVLVYDNGRHEIVKPAFTLPTYAGLVVEYADKSHDSRRMERVYHDNGIPAVIIRPEEMQSFKGPAGLIERIEQAARQYKSLMRYPATSIVQPSMNRYSP